jgi:hypothetical protein
VFCCHIIHIITEIRISGGCNLQAPEFGFSILISQELEIWGFIDIFIDTTGWGNIL